MSEQGQDAGKQPGVQAGAAAEKGQAGGTGTVRSEEVGHGPGLDPPSPPDDDEDAGGEEAFANRPNRPAEPAGTSTEGASIQRPPADS